MDPKQVIQTRVNRQTRLARPYSNFAETFKQCKGAGKAILRGDIEPEFMQLLERSSVITAVTAIEVYYRDILDYIFRYCSPNFFLPHIKQLHSEKFDIAELLENSASDRIHVWLSQKMNVSTERAALDSITVEDHSQALKLYWAGHSIYCRAPLELERSVVPRLLHEIGLGVTGSGTDKYRRGEIELFLSREGHTTGIVSLIMKATDSDTS